MAQFGVHGDWKGIAAFATLFVFFGMLAYATAGGLDHAPDDAGGRAKKVQFGAITYLMVTVAMVLGFWSKEDVVAILGIIGWGLLIVMDVVLKVGVLSFPPLTGA